MLSSLVSHASNLDALQKTLNISSTLGVFSYTNLFMPPLHGKAIECGDTYLRYQHFPVVGAQCDGRRTAVC